MGEYKKVNILSDGSYSDELLLVRVNYEDLIVQINFNLIHQFLIKFKKE